MAKLVHGHQMTLARAEDQLNYRARMATRREAVTVKLFEE